jgi:NDP-sugar pyrophosphorylase family protein
MKPTLLVLAAGMGTRYGGNKQLDEVGPSGETIIDYSIYDAIRAGFGKIVFVIRHDIEEQVKERFVNRLKGKIEVDYVFQEITNLPEGVKVSPERQKPWGTSHAILVTEKKISEPFGVMIRILIAIALWVIKWEIPCPITDMLTGESAE